MNSIRSIQALNKRELENVVYVCPSSHFPLSSQHIHPLTHLSSPPSASWHADYRDTSYIYVGGLPFSLTEGDLITIFSQFGEPVFVKLIRDKETGKSKGFGFLKYEDQRSCDLAVDNLGGATVLGRILRVDHTKYEKRDDDEEDGAGGNVGFQATGENKGSGEDGRRSPGGDDSGGESEKEPRDAIKREHDEEDPMKDYIAREKKERSKRREGSRERHGEGRHHRHRDERKQHRHHKRERSRSRSPRR